MATLLKLAVAVGAVLIALGCLRLAATRNRNAAPTLTRYIAPFRFQGGVEIVEIPSTLRGITVGPYDLAELFKTES